MSRPGPLLRTAIGRLRRAGLAMARQDAERLLAEAIGTTRLGLYLEPDRVIPPEPLEEFRRLLDRRVLHEPLQYLVGWEEFRGLRLRVGPGVFIPRPETELVVERALALLPDRPARTVDLGTGSGAIALALAAARPAVRVWAVERSAEARAWAEANVAGLGLGDQVVLLAGDLWAPLRGLGLEGTVDLVVSNPPYIPAEQLAELPEEVRAHEPLEALDGGPGGLALHRRILEGAPALLRPGGVLLLEIGEGQTAPLAELAAAGGVFEAPAFHRDLVGIERVLEARRR